MIKQITSSSNPRIKFLVTLRNRRQRDKTNLSIAEGKKEIDALLKSGLIVKELFVLKDKEKEFAQLLKHCSAKKVTCYTLASQVFSKVSYGNRNEGILAVFETKNYLLKDLPIKRNPCFVVVENVEKPGNLGAILRTCDGAGIDGLIVCDAKTDLFNPNVIRSSIGTVFSVRIAFAQNQEALTFLKDNKISIYASSPDAKQMYTKANFQEATALVVGSEQLGLTKFWLDQADYKIKIPMLGNADSLNVSASTAILLYETVRQRNK